MDIRIVYIREAHPTDGWRLKQNDRAGIEITEPKNSKEREEVASICLKNLKLSIPAVIDDMNNSVEKAYTAWPDRIYVIDKNGYIAYKGAPGPAGFNTKEAEAALKILLDTY